jgi:hypothetical protein
MLLQQASLDAAHALDRMLTAACLASATGDQSAIKRLAPADEDQLVVRRVVVLCVDFLREEAK